MSNDHAGIPPNVTTEVHGKEFTEADRKLIQNTLFYLEEIIKLFPQGARVALVASWLHSGSTVETVNLGNIKNMELINLLTGVEMQRRAGNNG